MPGVSTLEDTKTPQAEDICNDQGRGLHGVHMNYSSPTYGKKSTTRGNCNYCHNEHIHENGYVEFEGYTPSEALGTIASSSAVTLNAGGTGYAVGDIASINGGTGGAVTVLTVSSGTVLTFSVSSYRESHGYSVATGVGTTNVVGTGTGLTVNITSITNYGLRQTVDSKNLAVSGTGIDANGLDITLMNGVATCTGACHQGTSATNPAAWGNYTSVSINLSCVSCHDDSSNVNTTSLSGNHKNHLLSNCTTPAGVLLSAAANASCLACHPDQVNDLWSGGKADNGSKKAYPHASDGTNVVGDNATLTNQITSATKAGLDTTCANSCHPRGSIVTWGGTLDCNMCHYYGSPTLDTDNTGTGALSAGHTPHFKAGSQLACTECHPNRSDASHASKLPAAGYNVTVVRSGMTYDSVAKTCNNSGASCHGAGTTPSFTGPFNNGCGACHYYPGAPARDWSAGNGHMVRYDAPVVNTHMKATGFNYQTDTFAAVTVDNNKCGQCHKGVTHRNGSGFAHLSSAGNAQCGTGTFTVNVTTPGSNTTCSNVSCHSGRTTPNWW
jgi:hypothetical protein